MTDKCFDRMKLFIIVIGILSCLTLVSCGNADNDIETSIDNDALASAAGDYQCNSIYNSEDGSTQEGEWWHLSILEDYEGTGPYFSIYDNQAGNPGVEGRILYIDDTKIKILIDEEFYEQLPAEGWKSDGETLEVEYAMTELGIVLYNSNIEVGFIWD